MYEKIIKYLSLALLVIGAAIAIWGYAAGFPEDGAHVDVLFYWAYVMVGLGIISTVVVGLIISTINNPKSLIRLLIVLVGCAVVIGVAYVLASGDPLTNYMGTAPSTTTLKLTDTILNLTYIACGAAVLSIIVGMCVNAARNK